MIARRNAFKVMCGLEKFPKHKPFFFVFRSYDIPNTIEAMLRSLPKNCVGFSVNIRGGATMLRRAERVARQRGMKMIISNFGR